MNRQKAKVMARKLDRMGLKRTEIAKRLFEAGYASKKTGKPLSDAGVWTLLQRQNKKAKSVLTPKNKHRNSRKVTVTATTRQGKRDDDILVAIGQPPKINEFLNGYFQ